MRLVANSSTRQVVDVGTVIAETYRIEALIGRGGMGSVFLATHARLPGKQVAIKLLHADLDDTDVIARFKREAEIASRLGHPNIVGIHDFNVLPDGTPYLVLDYLDGESLGSRLRKGALALDAIFSITRQVGSALAAAHREGIVHRDLKPANIFLVPTEVDGKIVEIAKVLDFGISKMRGSTTVKTQEFTLLGTPQYMAPEQAKGEHGNIDERTDIFALGSIVYEMLAGQPAFSGENIPVVCFRVVYEEPLSLAEAAPATPPSVIQTVARAMSKAPSERFASINLFVEHLTGEQVMPFVSRGGISIPPPNEAATGQDAFALTVSSGDFGIAASTPPPRLTPIRTVEPIDPHDATRASIPPSPPVTAPPETRSRGPLLVLVFAGIALVIYLVTRGGGSTVPDAAFALGPDAVIEQALEATLAPDAAVIVIAEAEVIGDAAPVIADAPRVVDAAVRVVVPDPGDEHDETGPFGAAVTQVIRALASRDYDVAEKGSTVIINSVDSTARQKIRARSIRAVVRCVARFNEEQAGLDLKAIPLSYRALRKTVLDQCHAAGYLASTEQ